MSLEGLAGTAFVDLEPRFGPGFGAGLVTKLKGLAGPAAIAGVAGGLFAVGEKFEGIFNRIKVQTGATGPVFAKLKENAKDVLGGTAGSFDQVSAAVGGLFTRTHLLGPALDDLAKKQVVLGRITKTDVGANVEATTSLFNRYGIAAKDQSAKLDVLFKASQAGGKGIGILTSELQKGAPALSAFGFGFDKSAALVASLERAGINVTPVLTGLRTAFGKIAKEGKDPQVVLAGIFKELRDGKDPTKATGDAIALFGAKGGKELSDAIRGGRFDVDALLKTITNGKGGIRETGAEVSTLGGKFALLKNKALVAIEPIATKLVDLANVGLAKVVDGVVAAGPTVGRVFGFIGDKVSAAATRFAPTFNRVKALATNAFLGARDVIANFSDFVHGNAAGIGVAIGRMFGLSEDSGATAGIIRFAQGFRDALGSMVTSARTTATAVVTAIRGVDFGAIFGGIRNVVAGVVTAVRGIDFGAIFGRLKAIVGPILPPLRELATAVIHLAIAAFPVLVHTFRDALGFAQRLKPVFIALVGAGYILARVAGVVLGGALTIVAKATDLLAHHAGILRPIILGLAGAFIAWKAVQGVQAGILGAARIAGTAVGTFSRLSSSAASLFRSGSDTLRLRLMYARDGATKLFGVLKSGASTLAGFAKSFLTGAINIARQTAAYVAQKAAAIASAVATKAMAAAQWLLNVAMDANPVTLIVAGIAALAAGVVLAYQHFKPFRDIVDLVGRALATVARVITGGLGAAFGWIKGHWPLVLAILTGPFGLAVLFIKRFGPQILSAVTGALSGIGHAVTAGLGNAFGWVKSHWPLIAAILAGPFGLAVLLIAKNWSKITAGASAAFKAITGFFSRLPGQILGALSKAGGWLVDVGAAIVGGLFDGISTAWSTVAGFFTGLASTLTGELADAGHWLLHVGANIIGGLLTGLTAAWSTALRFFTGLEGRILRGLGNEGRWLLSAGKLLIGGLLTGLTGGFGAVLGFFTGLEARVVRGLGNVGAWLLDAGGKVIAGLLAGIKLGAKAVFDFYVLLPLAILKLFVKADVWLVNVGKRILIGLGNGIVTGAGLVLGWIGGLKDRILGYIGDASRWLYNIGKKIIGGLLDGLKDAFGSVKDFAGGVAGSVVHWVNPPPAEGWLLDIGKRAMGGLLAGLKAILPDLELELGKVSKTVAGTRIAPPTITGTPRARVAPELPSAPALVRPSSSGSPTFVRPPAVVDPRRFAPVFKPPAPLPTDRPVARAVGALGRLAPAAALAAQPVHQENHFHGHEKPTTADTTYAGAQLAWLVRNTGRRP